jgi:hypothetical protein
MSNGDRKNTNKNIIKIQIFGSVFCVGPMGGMLANSNKVITVKYFSTRKWGVAPIMLTVVWLSAKHTEYLEAFFACHVLTMHTHYYLGPTARA